MDATNDGGIESAALSALRIAAAWFSLKLAMSNELKQAAHRALDAGIYSPWLAEIATTSNPIMSDIDPLFENALRELGIEIPTRDEAPWVLITYDLQLVCAGHVTPREGVRRIADLYRAADLDHGPHPVVGEPRDVSFFISARWDYDDLEKRPDEISYQDKFGQEAMALFDEEVVRKAREWLEAHGPRARALDD